MENSHLHDRIKAVRFRMRVQRMLDFAAMGFAISAVAVICFGLMRSFAPNILPTGWVENPWIVSAVLFAGTTLFAMIAGFLWPRAARDAAGAIDAAYRLKDRTVTAVDFLSGSTEDVLRKIQIHDAARHVANVDPAKVVPFRRPGGLRRAAAMLLIAAIVILRPWSSEPAVAGPQKPNAELVNVAEQLEDEMVDELEEMVKENPEEETLKELKEQVQKLVEDLKQPGMEVTDALAKLSEIQNAMQKTVAEFNLEAVDSSLAELGESLAPAGAFRETGEDLAAGRFAEAASKLEKLDPSKLSSKERKTVAKKLDKTAKKMARRKQARLAECTGKLCKGVRSGKKSDCQDAGMCLGELCRKHSLRKGICKGLRCQLLNLSMCKCDCAGRCACKKNGGNCNKRSDSPSENWGRGTTGDPFGEEATERFGNHEQHQLSGTPGEGPSEITVETSPEGSQSATRSYSEAYGEYKKISESVLEKEPIPLGHRQTIRRYFEMIRPESGDTPPPSPTD